MNWIKAYLGFLVTFLAIDFVWISTFVTKVYQQDVPNLISASPNVPAAIAFYLLYALGAMILAVKPATSIRSALTLGAVYGVATYGTFTLTSYALFEGWTLRMAISDLAWGGALTGVATCAAYAFSRRGAAA